MPDWKMVEKFVNMIQDGYLGTLGAWVQIASPITTRLNAFNTLEKQHVNIGLFDQGGFLKGEIWDGTIDSGHALRLDLATLLGPDAPPFEGAVWVACKGQDAGEHNLGLQAIDLDFVDTSRPEGHVLGTVHVIQDFFNTLGIAPWLDLVSPRVLVEVDEIGAPRYTNYLGMAHHPVSSADSAVIEVRVANEAGEWLAAEQKITVPVFGSAFVSLETLIPGLPAHLMGPGGTRGYGAVNLREVTAGAQVGLCAMLKVTNNETGDFMVDHLNDRHFAKPTQKG